MDKLKMHTVNKVDENVEKIAKLFPNCVTEKISGGVLSIV
jgi:adenine-specific DNA-methyltransferase